MLEVKEIRANRQPTTPKPKNRSQESDDFNAFLENAILSLKNSEGNPIEQVHQMNAFCSKLVKFNNEMLTAIAIDKVSTEAGIKAHLLRNHLKRIGQIIVKSSSDEHTPDIVHLENFLSEHYDFYYNTISNTVMCKRKFADRYEEINLHNVIRHLRMSHFRYSIKVLKETLLSDFTQRISPVLQYLENLPTWDGVDYFDE
ncbi:MAG: hypothetical protein ACRC9X_02940, partial [Bacteroidales bacterium]